MSVSRAERRRQERAQRKAPPPPSDRELVGLLTDIAGYPVTDVPATLLEILPGHLGRDLDECVDMMRLAELSYPKTYEVYRGWSLVHEALGNLHLSGWLAGLAGETREFELCLALREQARFAQRRGDYGVMLEACSLWREEAPDEVEPKSNAQLARFMQGEETQALRDSERLWQQRPDSFLAGFRYFQILTLSGLTRQARALVDGLKAWSGQPDPEVQAEFLQWIAGDQEMVELWKRLRTAKKLTPLLRHYAAVSLGRCGQWAEARKQWRLAIEQDPSLRVARENLEKADSEHLPWPFEFWQLVPMTLLVRLMSHPESPLDRSPELLWRLPLLWERGGPMGQQMAMKLAIREPKHRCGVLLARFAQQRQGWDFLWGRELPDFEVHGEPRPGIGSVLMNEAMGHRQRGDWDRAEAIYRRLLEQNPTEPVALNNLAVCLEHRGDKAGFERILQENFAANPDYLFARLAMTDSLIREQRLEEAEVLLEPVLERRRFHISEFAMVCDVMLKLALFAKDYEGSELWMQAWDEETAHFGRAAETYRPRMFELSLKLGRELQASMQRSFAKVLG